MSWVVRKTILKSVATMSSGKPWPDIVNYQCFAICDQCKFEDNVAYGIEGRTLTTKNRIQYTKMIGWTIAPRMLCRKCTHAHKGLLSIPGDRRDYYKCMGCGTLVRMRDVCDNPFCEDSVPF